MHSRLRILVQGDKHNAYSCSSVAQTMQQQQQLVVSSDQSIGRAYFLLLRFQEMILGVSLILAGFW